MTNKSKGCPNDEFFCKIIKNNNFIGKLSEELCWENCPTIHVGGAHELFRSYPTNSPRRFVQRISIGGLPTIKTNIFV